MSDFLSGKFNRDKMGGFLRWLSPTAASVSILEIDPAELAELGKMLILIDVDNTILPWRSEDIPDSTKEWVDEAKSAGLELCILSNTRNPDRLERIAASLGVKAIRGKFKPSRAMYLQALEEFGVAAEAAIMIGDQLFTDVLGANRSGIDAIWVRPSSSRDFIGTKVSRMGEKLARKALYRHLEPSDVVHADMETSASEVTGIQGLTRFPIVGQFFRFCIVGGLSFVIDYCVRMTVHFTIPYGDGLMSDAIGARIAESFPGLFSDIQSPKDAFFPITATIGAIFGMANSFFWNRKWTFKIEGSHDRTTQLWKFLAISISGLLLNVLISSFLIHILPGDDKMRARLATVFAAAAVAFWNFGGQKFFAFRRRTDESVV
jgi:HAD superfamily phosphatase (TIGR01668 family)